MTDKHFVGGKKNSQAWDKYKEKVWSLNGEEMP